MARPRNASAIETRRRLVAAAAPLFAAGGRDGVSVREIAGAAKVTGATVLHYFGDKDGLYDACVEAMYQELSVVRGGVVAAIAAAEHPDEAIEAGVRSIFAIAREHRDAIRLLLRHVVDTGEIGVGPREKQLLPLLETGAALFADRTGRPALEVRLTLQSLVFLVGRWAIAAPREVAAVTGLRGAGAWKAVEDHLVEVAHRQLGRAS